MLYDKYRKNKTTEIKPDTIKLILNYVVDNKLVLYGGFAIDLLIRNKTNGLDSYYSNDNKDIDFDILVPDPYKNSLELAKILAEKGSHEYIRIVTGITGETRKIFIDLSSSAIVDMSPMKKFLDNIIEIKRDSSIIRVLEPQFLKEDQYKNISMNLFFDVHRIKKSIKKIDLLEKYFPISNTVVSLYNYKYVSYERDLPHDMDCIYGGDYVFNIYYPDNAVTDPEIILYTNDCRSGKYFPKIRVLPWEGATNFMWYDVKRPLENYVLRERSTNRDITKIKIISKAGLIKTYYQLFAHTKNIEYKKRLELIKISEEDQYQIDSPKILPRKKSTMSMETIWMLNGKVLI
jgi:hypothetical protein